MKKKLLAIISIVCAFVFVVIAVFLVAHRGFIVNGEFSYPAADTIITALIAGAATCLIFVVIIIWLKEKKIK